MNALTDEMSKYPTEVFARDGQPALLDVGKLDPLSFEEDNPEFAITLANLQTPNFTAKHSNTLTNKSVRIDFPSERTGVAIGADQYMPSLTLTAQEESGQKNLGVEMTLDDKITNAAQQQPNLIDAGQEIQQEKNNRIVATLNIDVPTINSGLIKIVPPTLGATRIPAPIIDNKKTGDTTLIDIDGAPEKTMPDRNGIVGSVTLLPKQLSPNDVVTNIGAQTALPAYNFTETNVSHAQNTSGGILSSSLGTANLQPQAVVHLQLPTQVQTLTQTVVTQVREPMLEHLGAAYEALQSRSGDKPKDIVVQLSPAELGRVQIRFSFDVGERVVAQIVAENPETLVVLRQKSGLLSAQLKLGGFENIDLSFDASEQKNSSEQNSNTDFFKNQSAQAKPNFWQTAKPDFERETQQLGVDDNVSPLRTRMTTQSAQIDVIL